MKVTTLFLLAPLSSKIDVLAFMKVVCRLLLWLAVVSGGNPWLWFVLIQPHGWLVGGCDDEWREGVG